MPNLEILIYERNWYLTYRFWPTSHNTHVFEADLWFAPSTTARLFSIPTFQGS